MSTGSKDIVLAVSQRTLTLLFVNAVAMMVSSPPFITRYWQNSSDEAKFAIENTTSCQMAMSRCMHRWHFSTTLTNSQFRLATGKQMQQQQLVENYADCWQKIQQTELWFVILLRERLWTSGLKGMSMSTIATYLTQTLLLDLVRIESDLGLPWLWIMDC